MEIIYLYGHSIIFFACFTTKYVSSVFLWLEATETKKKYLVQKAVPFL